MPDEDFWQNPVAPVPPTLYQRLPYASGETAEVLPQAVVPPDEDFWPPLAAATGGWQNPVAPAAPAIVGAVREPPLLSDIEEVPAGSLHGQPDEDFWANPVPPVPPALYQRLPYLPDVSDDPAGSLYGVPEETEWQNPQITQITQIAGRIFQLLPYASGEVAELLPAIVSDDDCWPPLGIATGGWQSTVGKRGVERSNYRLSALDFWTWWDEFASLWWTSTWGVHTHSPARARASHSATRKRTSRATARPRTSRGVSRQSSVISNQ
jgi:hypothetical protein